MPRRLSAGEQLLDALVRQAEHIGRVADAQAAVLHQSASRITGGPGGGLLGGLGVLALLAGELQAGFDRRRQPYVLDEVYVLESDGEPQRACVDDVLASLGERAPVRVDPGLLLELHQPVAFIVTLEHRRERLQPSHSFPRQGSGSRSMLLNVPGRMSPLCLGTTVWHDPHRTTTCEPL
jgi:hypothetical protein